MRLAGLFIYPVKSLRGCRVKTGAVDPLGLQHDRRFMVVDPGGRFLSQRTLPRMALIATEVRDGVLHLSAPAAGTVAVSCEPDDGAPLRAVSVWSSAELQAEDAGETPSAWLTRFLGTPCRLVRIGPAFHRPVLKPPAGAGTDHVVAFADGFPFLIVAEASLSALNDRLIAQGEAALPMDRFRPNLVVSGCAPHAEDSWTRFRIGGIVFRAAGPCARCTVTTTDQETAARGLEPLRTLARYRRDPADPTNVNFGQNLVHETKSGRLHEGDPVTLCD
jgi:uncharacterized protein YcbX